MADSEHFIDQRESYSSDEEEFREEFAGSTFAGYRFEPVVSSSEEDSASDSDSDDSDASLAGKPVETLDRTQTRDWCKCGECCTMDTDVECVCCREIDTVRDITVSVSKTCITGHPKLQTICLDRDVLSVAAITVSYMNRTKLPNPINDIFYRLTAYRQFTLWTYGQLGRKNRHVIPACVVRLIRKTFPELGADQATYSGFKEADSD